MNVCIYLTRSLERKKCPASSGQQLVQHIDMLQLLQLSSGEMAALFLFLNIISAQISQLILQIKAHSDVCRVLKKNIFYKGQTAIVSEAAVSVRKRAFLDLICLFFSPRLLPLSSAYGCRRTSVCHPVYSADSEVQVQYFPLQNTE